MVRFCITQKTPTQKSATARLARKKFVIERRRRDIVTTRMTSRFPEKQKRRENVNQYSLLVIIYY